MLAVGPVLESRPDLVRPSAWRLEQWECKFRHRSRRRQLDPQRHPRDRRGLPLGRGESGGRLLEAPATGWGEDERQHPAVAVGVQPGREERDERGLRTSRFGSRSDDADRCAEIRQQTDLRHQCHGGFEQLQRRSDAQVRGWTEHPGSGGHGAGHDVAYCRGTDLHPGPCRSLACDLALEREQLALCGDDPFRRGREGLWRRRRRDRDERHRKRPVALRRAHLHRAGDADHDRGFDNHPHGPRGRREGHRGQPERRRVPARCLRPIDQCFAGGCRTLECLDRGEHDVDVGHAFGDGKPGGDRVVDQGRGRRRPLRDRRDDRRSASPGTGLRRGGRREPRQRVRGDSEGRRRQRQLGHGAGHGHRDQCSGGKGTPGLPCIQPEGPGNDELLGDAIPEAGSRMPG